MTDDMRLKTLRELRDLAIATLALEVHGQRAAGATYSQMTDLAFALGIGETAGVAR